MSQLLERIKRKLIKPEYIFRPRQVLRRLQLNGGSEPESVQLPWREIPFSINPKETIGRALITTGVYDLAVTETFARVIEPYDIVCDVGANIGYFTSLASSKGAKVYSFEPHPLVFNRLKNNCDDRDVFLQKIALSDRSGQASLHIPVDFEKNEGIASLEKSEQSSEQVQVELQTLDQFMRGKASQIKLMKIDVEGHELSVLKGAERYLKENRIEYIVFEDFAGEDSAVIKYLNKMGYFVKRLHKGLVKPVIMSVEEGRDIPLWEPPNYLACKHERKLEDLFKQVGWKIYRNKAA